MLFGTTGSKRKHSIKKRAVAAAIAICFLFNSIAYGQIPSNIRLRSIPQIQIPAHLGSVELSNFTAASERPFLIHIQDAHANPEGQRNTAEIIRYLAQKHSIRKVFVEGAVENLDSKYLRFISDEKQNQKLIQKLVDLGEVTGAELALGTKGLQFIGIEDISTYRKNFDLFRDVMKQESVSKKFLKSYQHQLDQKASRVLEKNALQLFRHYLCFDKNNQNWIVVTADLQRFAKQSLNRDLSAAKEQIDFPNIVRLFQLKAEEGKINFEKAQAEERAIQKKYGSFSGSNFRSQMETLYQKASPLGFKFESYPHFTSYIRNQIFQQEIEAAPLFNEVKLLLDLLVSKMLPANLVREAKNFKLLEGLLNLELTQAEWNEAKEIRFEAPGADIAKKFYETAVQRESVFMKKIESHLRTSKDSRAIVITGGFHTNGMSRLFDRHEMPHLTIRPKVETDSSKIYRQGMMRGIETSEVVLAQLAQSRESLVGSLGQNVMNERMELVSAEASSLGEAKRKREEAKKRESQPKRWTRRQMLKASIALPIAADIALNTIFDSRPKAYGFFTRHHSKSDFESAQRFFSDMNSTVRPPFPLSLFRWPKTIVFHMEMSFTAQNVRTAINNLGLTEFKDIPIETVLDNHRDRFPQIYAHLISDQMEYTKEHIEELYRNTPNHPLKAFFLFLAGQKYEVAEEKTDFDTFMLDMDSFFDSEKAYRAFLSNRQPEFWSRMESVAEKYADLQIRRDRAVGGFVAEKLAQGKAVYIFRGLSHSENRDLIFGGQKNVIIKTGSDFETAGMVLIRKRKLSQPFTRADLIRYFLEVTTLSKLDTADQNQYSELHKLIIGRMSGNGRVTDPVLRERELEESFKKYGELYRQNRSIENSFIQLGFLTLDEFQRVQHARVSGRSLGETDAGSANKSLSLEDKLTIVKMTFHELRNWATKILSIGLYVKLWLMKGDFYVSGWENSARRIEKAADDGIKAFETAQKMLNDGRSPAPIYYPIESYYLQIWDILLRLGWTIAYSNIAIFEILKNVPLNSSEKEILEHLRRTVAFNDAVSRFTDLVRPEKIFGEGNNRAVDAVKIIETTKALYEDPKYLSETLFLGEKDHKLTIRTQLPGKPLPVRMSIVGLVFLLGNLINNAKRYNATEILIEAYHDVNSKNVIINVSNNGQPITSERIPLLFKQGESEDKKRADAGMGLALSKQLLESHEGDISLISFAGERTTFKIELPYIESSAASLGIPGASDQSLEQLFAKMWEDGSEHAFGDELPIPVRQFWLTFFKDINRSSPAARILDFATGNMIVPRLARKASKWFHIHGVDIVKPTLEKEIAASRLQFHLVPPDQFPETEPFREQSFHVVTSMYGVEYADMAKTLKWLSGRLAPGGRAAFVVHHKDSLIVKVARSEFNARNVTHESRILENWRAAIQNPTPENLNLLRASLVIINAAIKKILPAKTPWDQEELLDLLGIKDMVDLWLEAAREGYPASKALAILDRYENATNSGTKLKELLVEKAGIYGNDDREKIKDLFTKSGFIVNNLSLLQGREGLLGWQIELQKAANSETIGASLGKVSRRNFLKFLAAGGAAGLVYTFGTKLLTEAQDDAGFEPNKESYRFAPKYPRADLLTSADSRARFIREYLTNEGKFHQAGVSYNGTSGLTYDGHSIDSNSGALRGAPRNWSASSKESLHVGLLALAVLNEDERVKLFIAQDNPTQSVERALDILTKKISSYEKFNRDFPGFGGFLPWFLVTDGGMQPTHDWQTRVPALDNGQLAWSLYLAHQVLKEKGHDVLARRYKAQFDLMAQNVLKIFYDGDGKIRGEVRIGNTRANPTRENYSKNADYYLADPYEGELMAFFMVLFGDWTPFGGAAESEKIWRFKRRNLEAAIYRTPNGPVTVQKGHWFSAHEQWKYLVLPYVNDPTARKIFENGEKVRTQYSAERRIPGLFASVHETVSGNESPQYVNDLGIAAVARQTVDRQDIVTPYASFPVILAGPAGMGTAWLHLMLSANRMQGPYGSSESTNVTGTQIAPILSWDGKVTTVAAVLGGFHQQIARYLRQDGKLDRFLEIVRREHQAVFTDIKGDRIPFAPPTAEIPKAISDFSSGRSLGENKIKLQILPDKKVLAKEVARRIVEIVKKNPRAVLGLATGGTMEDVYKEIIELFKADTPINFSQVITFNLDEYLGLAPTNPQSYRFYMEKHLFGPLREKHWDEAFQKENTFVFDGLTENPQKEVERYLNEIRKRGGIDFQLLGIGTDGHFAFVEPAKEVTDLTLRDFNDFMIDEKIPDGDLPEAIKRMLVLRAEIRGGLGNHPDLVKHLEESRKEYFRANGADDEPNIHELQTELNILGRRLLAQQDTTLYISNLNQRKIDLILDSLPENLKKHLILKDKSEFFETGAKLVSLALPTILDNARYYDNANAMKLKALTLAGEVRKAREILLAATGRKKAEAIRDALSRPVSPDVTSSIFQQHDNTTFIVDTAAAVFLPEEIRMKTQNQAGAASLGTEPKWVQVNYDSKLIEDLMRLSHASIPKFRKNEQTGNYEIQWVEGRRWFDWIDETSQMSGEDFLKQTIQWTIQIGEAVMQMDRAEIVHGDIVIENIMIEPGTNNPVLIDWDDHSHTDFGGLKRLIADSVKFRDEYIEKKGNLLDAELTGLFKNNDLKLAQFVEELKKYYDRKWLNGASLGQSFSADKAEGLEMLSEINRGAHPIEQGVIRTVQLLNAIPFIFTNGWSHSGLWKDHYHDSGHSDFMSTDLRYLADHLKNQGFYAGTDEAGFIHFKIDFQNPRWRELLKELKSIPQVRVQKSKKLSDSEADLILIVDIPTEIKEKGPMVLEYDVYLEQKWNEIEAALEKWSQHSSAASLGDSNSGKPVSVRHPLRIEFSNPDLIPEADRQTIESVLRAKIKSAEPIDFILVTKYPDKERLRIAFLFKSGAVFKAYVKYESPIDPKFLLSQIAKAHNQRKFFNISDFLVSDGFILAFILFMGWLIDEIPIAMAFAMLFELSSILMDRGGERIENKRSFDQETEKLAMARIRFLIYGSEEFDLHQDSHRTALARFFGKKKLSESNQKQVLEWMRVQYGPGKMGENKISDLRNFLEKVIAITPFENIRNISKLDIGSLGDDMRQPPQDSEEKRKDLRQKPERGQASSLGENRAYESIIPVAIEVTNKIFTKDDVLLLGDVLDVMLGIGVAHANVQSPVMIAPGISADQLTQHLIRKVIPQTLPDGPVAIVVTESMKEDYLTALKDVIREGDLIVAIDDPETAKNILPLLRSITPGKKVVVKSLATASPLAAELEMKLKGYSARFSLEELNDLITVPITKKELIHFEVNQKLFSDRRIDVQVVTSLLRRLAQVKDPATRRQVFEQAGLQRIDDQHWIVGEGLAQIINELQDELAGHQATARAA